MTRQRRADLAAVWAPLVLVLLTAGGRALLSPGQGGWLRGIVQAALLVLVYGAGPYALWALYASREVLRRPAHDLARLRRLAPMQFGAAYVVLALIVGVLTGRLVAFMMVGAIGLAVAIALGYPWLLLTRLAAGRLRVPPDA